MALYLIDNATITRDTVTIKFGRTIKISSLVNANFTVFTDEATPQQVISPFKTIDTLMDYNQVSRVLTLRWKVILQSNTNYKINAQNLVDSSGITVATESLSFSTAVEAATPGSLLESSAPVVNEILVEDKSIRRDISVGYQILAKNPNFYIDSTNPSNGEFYLNEDENDGRVTIVFNSRPASNFLNKKYFKAQRKKIQRTPVRWEQVEAKISMHSWKPEVYVDFPSNDATPVYNTEDKIYFESGYKYRIIVSSEVGI